MDNSRRSLLKGLAWGIPAVTLAVAVPAANASYTPEPCEKQYWEFDPRTTTLEAGKNDKVIIRVMTGHFVEIEYLEDVDSIDVNIKKLSGNLNFHPNRAAKKGEILTFKLDFCDDPSEIQVHGNNIHYRGKGVFWS